MWGVAWCDLFMGVIICMYVIDVNNASSYGLAMWPADVRQRAGFASKNDPFLRPVGFHFS